MTFLQTTIDPEVIISMNDSIKNAADSLIQKAKSDPGTFMHELGEHFIEFGLKLLAAIVIYLVGAWIIGRIKKALNKLFVKRGTEKTLASFTSSLVSISLTILLIVITIGTLGINTTSLAALLAAGGMAIGMALSGTVSNFAGGIMILAFKPFKVGDFINAQGYSGTVQSVTIVNTKILTTDNRLIIIPNGALSNGNIDNYNAMPLRRVDIEVQVEYETDEDLCIKLLHSIITKDKRVLDSKTPGAQDPFIALLSMNDSNISFITRSWVNAPDYWPVKFDLNKKIYETLPQNGIHFAYPQLNVTIKN
ncbi:MAG: mechanosensitive ion channel [Bacteroidaceae bacterium]|nr:mechanosensitive ion channel [Bacteroidaceae bacterium]